jgi:hypothetical protein
MKSICLRPVLARIGGNETILFLVAVIFPNVRSAIGLQVTAITGSMAKSLATKGVRRKCVHPSQNGMILP